MLPLGIHHAFVLQITGAVIAVIQLKHLYFAIMHVFHTTTKRYVTIPQLLRLHQEVGNIAISVCKRLNIFIQFPAFYSTFFLRYNISGCYELPQHLFFNNITKYVKMYMNIKNINVIIKVKSVKLVHEIS